MLIQSHQKGRKLPLFCFTLIPFGLCWFSVINMDVGYPYKTRNSSLSNKLLLSSQVDCVELLKKSNCCKNLCFLKKSLLAVDLHAPTSVAVAGYL